MAEFNDVPIIDPRKKPSWWKGHHPLLAWIAAGAGVLAALASWYAAYLNYTVTRQGIVAEHRPVLEITHFEFMDKNNMKILAKNSGRSAALKLRNEPWCDIGKYMGGIVGPALKVEKSFPTGVFYMPDVPTGTPFEMSAFIP